ncbi:MAG TPA: SDR family oxidoreductase [Pseudomonadota bacterium]|jgi:uncharacterized protein YbjT (DUF2867 family)|nr:SDR family oxidoreductase [Pseudomonadota bacterium]
MSHSKILVTGASGNTGRAVAEELQRQGVPFVAMTHSSTNMARFKAQGIDVIFGDFDAPETLRSALSGTKKAYLVCTPDEKLVRRETAFIRAASEAGVEHVVMCSAYLSGVDAETQNLRSHGVIENILKTSGMAYTIIRPVGFMQTFTLFVWDMVQRAGAISLPAGDGGMALVDTRDVAMIAVKALTESGHEGKVYDVTGPESLSPGQQADILGRVLGRKIHYLPMEGSGLSRVMSVLGVPVTPAEHVIKIFRMQREHRLEVVLHTQRDLGIVPTTYEQFVHDYVAGRTQGGNSFEPLDTLFVRAFNQIAMLALRVRVFWARHGIGNNAGLKH